MGKNIVWNDAANAKLLFAIISTSNAKVDYKAVAEIMGNGCTPIAIQRRLSRIKSKVVPDGNTSSPATTPKYKAGKATKKRVAEEASGNDSDTKKVKQDDQKESEDSN
ncbi:hypothetical protein McanMca71_002830 [Microsporum canis]|uniref:AT hook motif protein n=1 Tax=Arthroderma otae (strain ATCC MYA-4605 / CBS 113480) TaxID=554155 RepID=C5FVP8_ARTOC|nr:uncharacterized protein MCYG_06801 [Microsporum canis CBS 113480]EEQ33982.1 predicted protein [Microsporum canis CBS 113480]